MCLGLHPAVCTNREHFSGEWKNGRRNLQGRAQVWPLRAVTGAHGRERKVLSSHISICSRLWAAEVVLHSHQNASHEGTCCQGHRCTTRRPAPRVRPTQRCPWAPARQDLPGAFSPCLSSSPTAPRQGEQGRTGAGAWRPDHRRGWPEVKRGTQGSKLGSGLALVTSRAGLRPGQGQSVGQGLNQ